MPLKGGKAKVDWLGISRLEKRHPIEFLDFLFLSHIWQTVLRRGLQRGTAKDIGKKQKERPLFLTKGLGKEQPNRDLTGRPPNPTPASAGPSRSSSSLCLVYAPQKQQWCPPHSLGSSKLICHRVSICRAPAPHSGQWWHNPPQRQWLRPSFPEPPSQGHWEVQVALARINKEPQQRYKNKADQKSIANSLNTKLSSELQLIKLPMTYVLNLHRVTTNWKRKFKKDRESPVMCEMSSVHAKKSLIISRTMKNTTWMRKDKTTSEHWDESVVGITW